MVLAMKRPNSQFPEYPTSSTEKGPHPGSRTILQEFDIKPVFLGSYWAMCQLLEVQWSRKQQRTSHATSCFVTHVRELLANQENVGLWGEYERGGAFRESEMFPAGISCLNR